MTGLVSNSFICRNVQVLEIFHPGARQRLVTTGGMKMFSVLMTCMLTWRKRGLSPQKMLLEALRTTQTNTPTFTCNLKYKLGPHNRMASERLIIRAIPALVLVVVLLPIVGSDALAETDEELIQLIKQYESADKEIERIKESGDPNGKEQIKQKEVEKAEYLKVLNRNNVVTEEQFEADRNGANIQIPAKEFGDDHSGHKNHEHHSILGIPYLALSNPIGLMSHCCDSSALAFKSGYAYHWLWNWLRYVSDNDIQRLATVGSAEESETIFQSDYENKRVCPYGMYNLENANYAAFTIQYASYDAEEDMIDHSWDLPGMTTGVVTYWHQGIESGLVEEGGRLEIGASLDEIS